MDILYRKESCGKESQSRKSKDTFSRKGVENILNEMSDEKFEDSLSMNLEAPNEPANVEKVVCAHDSIFIGGDFKFDVETFADYRRN